MGLLSSIFGIFSSNDDLVLDGTQDKIGLRVQVKAIKDDDLYFIAKLVVSSTGIELYQESNISESFIGSGNRVLIRAFDSSEKKVIRLSGIIQSISDGVWSLEDIAISSIGDDREFYRQDVNTQAFIITDNKPIECTVLNISSGGVRIRVSGIRHNIGDKMLVSIPLIPNTIENPVECFIRNISNNEYGCKFNRLDTVTADQIAKKILEIQFNR